jgi:hypothetical protein
MIDPLESNASISADEYLILPRPEKILTNPDPMHEFNDELAREGLISEKSATLLRIINSCVFYVYILRYENGTPFYVGKGQGIRCFRHQEDAERPHNKRAVHQTIRTLWDQGQSVVTEIEGCYHSENEAMGVEMKLIATFGTLKNGTGPLVNTVTRVSTNAT